MRRALTAAQPIGADEFAALMKVFSPIADKIALAVSGGPDSMALALCAMRWGQRPLIAFIVDHGLRDESTAEAQQVKTRLSQMGIDSEILRWEHEAVTSALHQQARDARYKLLLDACRRHGAGDLLLAHHRDDQAETILMRLAKGSGIDGLAGMAAQTRREDMRLLRPFLGLGKDRLLATCRDATIDVVTDPSNDSDKFARGRLRKILPLLAAEGLTIDNLVMLGQRAGEASAALEFYLEQFLRGAARADRGGTLRLDRAALRALPRAVALRAVAACLRYIHDATHPPDYDSLSALLDFMRDGATEGARTLSGCIASVAADKILFLREPAAAQERLAAMAGQTVLWDQRWLVTLPTDAEGPTIAALGEQAHDLLDRLAPTLRHTVPQGRARASLPALWRGETLVAIPSFDATGGFHLRYHKLPFP